MLSFSRLLALTSFAGSVLVGQTDVQGQQLTAPQNVTRSILAIEDVDEVTTHWDEELTAEPKVQSKVLAQTTAERVTPTSTSVPVSLTSKSGKPLKSQVTEGDQTELVRERHPNGKPRTERHVTLNAEGNYVNHGEYRQFSDKGDLLVTGVYYQGQRVGVWAKFLQPGDAKLLTSFPFNKFRAPFSSTVEFDADRMNGIWVISDRDKRIASQIELKSGTRNGTMTFYHPNGQIYLQANFNEGVLDGLSIEKNQDGKAVHEDQFVHGQKLVVETDRFPNKSVKSVMRLLTAPQKVVAEDSWETTTLAAYSASGSSEQHGEFVTYHENGQVATKGTYRHGALHGSYESWFKTGEPSASGSYDEGTQIGEWTWRHANGMKRAMATYVEGKVQGETRAWDEAGKSISN